MTNEELKHLEKEKNTKNDARMKYGKRYKEVLVPKRKINCITKLEPKVFVFMIKKVLVT